MRGDSAKPSLLPSLFSFFGHPHLLFLYPSLSSLWNPLTWAIDFYGEE